MTVVGLVERGANLPSVRARSISASRVWKPRFIAAWIRRRACSALQGRCRRAGSDTATPLQDGTVLITYGGAAALYDPSARSFSSLPSMIRARGSHTASLLSDGTVLIAGGGPGAPIADAELYVPATRSFRSAGRMQTPRWGQTATLSRPTTGAFDSAGDMPWGSSTITATRLTDGNVLLVLYLPPR